MPAAQALSTVRGYLATLGDGALHVVLRRTASSTIATQVTAGLVAVLALLCLLAWLPPRIGKLCKQLALDISMMLGLRSSQSSSLFQRRGDYIYH